MAKRAKLGDGSTVPVAVAGQEEADFPRGGTDRPEFAEKSSKKRKRDVSGHGLPSLRSALKGKPSVDMLRYKKLSVGMKILGSVAEVRSKDVVISLPCGLRGFVPVNEAGDGFGLTAEGAKVEKNSQGQPGLDSALSLRKLFDVGQLVPCTVTKLELRTSSKRNKDSRRVELSLRLSRFYKGFNAHSLHQGLTLFAHVSSVEDHGYGLSIGVASVSGFLLHQEGGAGPGFKVGQIVHGVVSAADMRQGTFIMNGCSKALQSSILKENEGLSLDLLVPGSLVEAKVKSIATSGLVLSFLTFFSGTVDLFHLEEPLAGLDWRERYVENQKLRARILYVDPSTKSVALALNKHLVEGVQAPLETNVGEVCDNARICRVDPAVGLLLELPLKSKVTAAYVHISHASDEHIEKLETKFKVGKEVKARVIGFRPLDGLAVASLKVSVLEQPLLSLSDVKAGLIVRGKVKAVESVGVFVYLAEGMEAFCPLRHLSEIDGVVSNKKFKVDATLKFRVLVSPPVSKKIALTHKRSLVNSKLAVITSYEDAVEGLVTHGWISRVEEYGCVVSFYNKVKGLAHRSELLLDPGTQIHSVYHVGQVVKCRVLRANPQLGRMSVSLNFSASRNKEVSCLTAGSSDVKPGSTVSAVVTKVCDTNLLLEVSSAGGPLSGVMEFSHLSDSMGHVDQLKALLKPGYEFDKLLVLAIVARKLVLSCKFSLIQAAPALPTNIGQLEVQSVLPGYVASVTAFGVFVRFLSGLTGLAINAHVSDSYVKTPSSVFSPGQSVRACILEVDAEANKFMVSLRQSVCFSTDASLIESYFQEEDRIWNLQVTQESLRVNEIQIGMYVEGKVQDIKEYGIIVKLQENEELVGFVTHYQVSGDIKVGQDVKARVLDVVKTDGIVDLTLRSELMLPVGARDTPKKKRSHGTMAQVLDVSQQVEAVVELVKDEYLVLSLPAHGSHIAFASTRDYNIRVLDPHQQYSPGQKVTATVCKLQAGGRDLVLLSSFGHPLQVVSSRKARKDVKFQTGSLVQGEVLSIDSSFMYLALGTGVQGRIHITEVQGDWEEGNPFDQFHVGQMVTAKVLAKLRVSKSGGKNVLLELSLKVCQIPDATEESTKTLPTLYELKVGNTIMGFVQEVNEEWAWLVVTRHLRGRLYVLDSSDSIAELERFTERFKVGQAVSCKISKVDYEHGTVDLTLRGLDSWECVQTPAMKVGDVRIGRIVQIFSGAGGLSLQIGAHTFGRVHVTDMASVWEDDPGKKFGVGQFVQCVVVGVSDGPTGGSVQVDLSLKASDIAGGSVATELLQLTPGVELQAYVKSTSKKGCFVSLSRHQDARILLCNLSDSFVADPFSAFPPGKVVKGRVVSVDPASGLVDMSLKKRVVHVPVDPARMEEELRKLRVGDILVGSVRRVETFGIFITLQPSSVVGMCHISEISDDFVDDIQEQYPVGKKLQVKILKIDANSKRVSLGLKASYLNTAAGGTDSHASSEGEEEEEPRKPLHQVDGATGMSVETSGNAREKQADGLTLSSVPPLEVFCEPHQDEIQAAESKGTGTEDGEGMTEQQPVKEERAKKSRTDSSLVPAGEVTPETSKGFEKLLAASPSSSFLWIKYMAFMLSRGEAEKARAIAERALKAISFRDEAEKENMWIAYLNLEYQFGSEGAVDNIFQRALAHCNPKSISLTLLDIYQRHEQHEKCEELLNTMTRKFKTSAKVWIRKVQSTLWRGSEATRTAAFDRALLSLPERKHLKFVSQAGILEFKSGSPERARALFEGILKNYPKRADLWNLYLDQEIRAKDVTLVRALFERITCLDLPSKKMKLFFKRFLDYEKANGDQDRVEYVKQKAMAYVDSKLG